jgi:Nitrous oxide-stimulated promoter
MSPMPPPASPAVDLTTVKAAASLLRYHWDVDEQTARPPRRLAREEKTIAAMIALYCRDHHTGTEPHGAAAGASKGHGGPSPGLAGDGLCSECSELLAYARLRLGECRYGAAKPTCANCATHCYRPAMRERVREVMRYSGPRMLKLHPVLALAHLVDGRKTPGEG